MAVPEDTKPADSKPAADGKATEVGKPAADGEDRSRAAGKPLPVTSFEEMLLTSDRTHRPATVPPGVLTAAAIAGTTGSHAVVDGDPKRSSSGLRRVHVLTEDAIVHRPITRPPTGTSEHSDVIIGGTRAEMEAASRATTVKLDPKGALEAASQAEAAASPATTPPAAAPTPATPPPDDEPTKPADATFWWVLAGLVVAVVVALSFL